MIRFPLFVRASAGACCAILIALGILSCERECVNCPCEDDVAKAYNFYVYQTDGPTEDNYRVYIWNSGERRITDSILIDEAETFNRIAVSVDESHLIISSTVPNNRRTRIYNLATRQMLREYQFGGQIAVSPDGRFIAIQGNELTILNGNGLEVVTTDSQVVIGGMFVSSGEYFYGVIFPYTVVRYETGTWDTSAWALPFTNIIWSVIATDDNERVYLWTQSPTFSTGTLGVYYPITDSAAQLVITGGRSIARMRLVDDGHTLLFTDPRSFDLQGGNVSATFLNVDFNRVESVHPNTQPGGPGVNATEIAVSPDGKTCVFASSLTNHAAVMDLETRTYITFFRLQNDSNYIYSPGSVACRKWR